MTPLSDHFGKYVCKMLEQKYGIRYVEEAQAMTDKELYNNRGIGKLFLYKLRKIVTDGDYTKKPLKLDFVEPFDEDVDVFNANAYARAAMIYIEYLERKIKLLQNPPA